MKNSHNWPKLLAILVVTLAAPNSLHSNERQLDSHEHGVSTLQLAQENNTIVFVLEAPGNDIVGFEHAAQNASQKLAVKNALLQLENPEEIFELPTQASCKVSNKKAEFETEDEHAGFHVTWTMTCDYPLHVKSMTVRFFDFFERAEEIEVEAIGDAGQAAIEVEKGQKSVDLSQVIGG